MVGLNGYVNIITLFTIRVNMGNIILFYKYIPIEKPNEIINWQRKVCTELNLKGRILIATEGINGTLGGIQEAVDRYVAIMRAHTLFSDVDFKESIGVEDHFPRLRIVLKKEIVNLGINPEDLQATQGGTHLDPAQAHNLIKDKPDDLVILDCRNDFESKIGSFEDAVKAPIKHFRDFPAYVDQHLDLFKDKQVLMYCTGGVRCERGSAYLKTKGVAKEVYQIKGGIHRYVEEFPDGFFRGKNYVFDGRITMQVTDDILTTCSLCPTPCDEYTNCLYATCNKHFICCATCLSTYQNTCSPACYELIYQHHAPKRPMRQKSYTTSCALRD